MQGQRTYFESTLTLSCYSLHFINSSVIFFEFKKFQNFYFHNVKNIACLSDDLIVFLSCTNWVDLRWTYLTLPFHSFPYFTIHALTLELLLFRNSPRLNLSICEYVQNIYNSPLLTTYTGCSVFSLTLDTS